MPLPLLKRRPAAAAPAGPASPELPQLDDHPAVRPELEKLAKLNARHEELRIALLNYRPPERTAMKEMVRGMLAGRFDPEDTFARRLEYDGDRRKMHVELQVLEAAIPQQQAIVEEKRAAVIKEWAPTLHNRYLKALERMKQAVVQLREAVQLEHQLRTDMTERLPGWTSIVTAMPLRRVGWHGEPPAATDGLDMWLKELAQRYPELAD
jgi:hypothetical protein